MSKVQLKVSLALWRRRHTYRQRQLDIAHQQNDVEGVKKWHTLLVEAGKNVDRRQAQLVTRSGKPAMVTAESVGLQFQNVFGTKGPIRAVAGHYSAGPRRANMAALIMEARSDQGFHAGKGWGGLSYEYMIADDGSLLLGNPTWRKSAAVASHNTGLMNICCPATTGDHPTDAFVQTLKWLLANAHTSALPSAHRSPVDLRTLRLTPHREFPDQSTACPGSFSTVYRTKGQSR